MYGVRDFEKKYLTACKIARKHVGYKNGCKNVSSWNSYANVL